MPAGNRIHRRLAGTSIQLPWRFHDFLVGRDSVEPDVKQPPARRSLALPKDSPPTPRLGARGAGFFDQLALCFDPVVGGVACQGKLDPPLRDKIRPKPDLFVRWLRGRSGRRSFFGGGGLANGFLLRGRLLLPKLRGRAGCFRFGPGAAGAWFRSLAVRLFFCFDFGFSSHVFLPPIECPIYRRGRGCKRILQTGCVKSETSSTLRQCDTLFSAG